MLQTLNALGLLIKLCQLTGCNDSVAYLATIHLISSQLFDVGQDYPKAHISAKCIEPVCEIFLDLLVLRESRAVVIQI